MPELLTQEEMEQMAHWGIKHYLGGFRGMLVERQKRINSLVCVGLDPMLSKMPECMRRDCLAGKHQELTKWMCAVVDATAPYASMYKPNRAFYENIDQGTHALRAIIQYIHERYSDIPVFLDCKRGDIGKTQSRYREAHFDLDGADGINFSPYMGKACMSALVSQEDLQLRAGNSLVGLCYTSNPEAREMQEVHLLDGRQYWQYVAQCTLRWAQELGVMENAGLVMAAAYKRTFKKGEHVRKLRDNIKGYLFYAADEEETFIYDWHLQMCREIVGDRLWFLIPGIGAQGGFVEATVKHAYCGPGSIAINSSSGICMASSGDDFQEAAANAAKALRDEIRKTADLYK